MSNSIYEYSFQIKKERKRKAIFVFSFIIFVFIVVSLILKFLLLPIRQTSLSMQPDIPENSMIFVTPLDTHPSRGDVCLIKPKSINKKYFINGIVSFFTGQQFSLNENKEIPETNSSLRRVIGMPGDTLYMRDYVLYIKPQGEKHFLTEFELIKRPYNVTLYSSINNWDDSLGVKGSFEEFTLADDEYFVLGDNRTVCADSRIWGPVSSDVFEGKALLCYFPFSEIKFF